MAPAQLRAGDHVTFDCFGGELTTALVALWTRCAPDDPITAARFRDAIVLDPNFEPAGLQVAFVGDELVGAAYAVRRIVAAEGADLEAESGWLLFFFVDPDHRGDGIGTALVERALAWLDRPVVHFSPYTPNYVLPGLDAQRYPAAGRLLRRLGFTEAQQAVAMQRALTDYETPPEEVERLDALRRSGYQLRPATDEDLPELLTLARWFSADWARAMREAVAGGLPVERIVLVREPAGPVVGWAMHGTYYRALDRFGPFGVLERCRGAGLGSALLHLTLSRMRAAGADRAWFLWTTAESPAGRLYRRAGFSLTRTFAIMRRADPYVKGLRR